LETPSQSEPVASSLVRDIAPVRDVQRETTPSRRVTAGQGEVQRRTGEPAPVTEPGPKSNPLDVRVGAYDRTLGLNPARPARPEPQAAAPRAAGRVLPPESNLPVEAGVRGRDATIKPEPPAAGAVRPPGEVGRPAPASRGVPEPAAAPQGLRPRVSEVVFRRDAERRVVNVTIGRIEVRAATPSTPARAAAPPAGPKLTLEKYLEQRDKGER